MSLPFLDRQARSLMRLGATVCIAAMAACTDAAGPATAPPMEHEPRPSVSDAAHGGNPGFHFLAPLVRTPAYHGTFDASVEAVVEICVMEAQQCGAPVARFTRSEGTGSEVLRVDTAAEAYVVNWHTDATILDPARVYRLRVLVHGIELGHADIDVVGAGRELRRTGSGEGIVLVGGRTLPVRFRIEAGAAPAASAFIGAGGGTLALPAYGSALLPAGSFGSGRTVSLVATRQSDTELDFRETLPTRLAVRAPWELRVNTGGSAPLADVDIVVNVPADFRAALPPGSAPALWVQLYQDGGEDLLDGMVLLPSEDHGSSLQGQLPADAFTDQRRADATFEAIVILGAVPVAERSGATMSVAAAVAPTCEGSPLSPAMEGDLTVNSAFGTKGHKGVDYRAATGDRLVAPANGVIERIGWDARPLARPDPRSGLMVKGWGRYVRIRLDDGSSVLLAHLVAESVSHLAVDQRVSVGDFIGLSNNTGGSTGPHLHMEHVTKDGRHVDPHACTNVAPPADFSGLWKGWFDAFDGQTYHNGTWTWNLAQSGSVVTGTTNIEGGAFSGTVRGSTLTYTTTYYWGGTMSGTATINGDNIHATVLIEVGGEIPGTANLSRVSATSTP